MGLFHYTTLVSEQFLLGGCYLLGVDYILLSSLKNVGNNVARGYFGGFSREGVDYVLLELLNSDDCSV